MLPLTKKQRQLYDYFRQFRQEKGHFPSLRQAAADLDISHTAVASLIRSLEKKGWLRRDGRYSRIIHLQDEEQRQDRQGKMIPIVGRVAAGLPLYAQQEWAGTVMVDPSLFRGQNLFALRVSGDSMRDIGILDQDLVICEPRQYAENGEIVVALIAQEEATVKRFFYHGDRIELRPENPAYSPMFFALGEVLVQGRVIGVQRGPEQMKRW